MKTKWNSSSYGNDLRMTSQDANKCTHPGKCDDDVKEVMSKKYISKQLENLNPEELAKELKEYGAWNEDELKNHEDNLMRWVWISAGDIFEGR